MKKINKLIPCNTNHIAVFNDGSEKEIIGWASKNNVIQKAGDVEQVSNISGLVVDGDEVIFADDLPGFSEYKSKPKKEMINV